MSFKSRKPAKALAVLLSSVSFMGGETNTTYANDKINLLNVQNSKNSNQIKNKFSLIDWIKKNPKKSALIGISSILGLAITGFGTYKAVSYIKNKTKTNDKGNFENKILNDKVVITNNGEIVCEESRILNNIYEIQNVLGSGMQGIVYLCKNIKTNQKVVIKRPLKHELADKSGHEDKLKKYQQVLDAELLAMKKFKELKTPPQITKPIEYFYDESKNLYLVYEYIPNKLEDFKSQLKNKSPKDRRLFVLDIAKQIIKTLVWFEENNLCYCDFKEFENLIITSDDKGNPLVKIIDFGSLIEGEKLNIRDFKEMEYLCETLFAVEKAILKGGDGEKLRFIYTDFHMEEGDDIRDLKYEEGKMIKAKITDEHFIDSILDEFYKKLNYIINRNTPVDRYIKQENGFKDKFVGIPDCYYLFENKKEETIEFFKSFKEALEYLEDKYKELENKN